MAHDGIGYIDQRPAHIDLTQAIVPVFSRRQREALIEATDCRMAVCGAGQIIGCEKTQSPIPAGGVFVEKADQVLACLGEDVVFQAVIRFGLQRALGDFSVPLP